MAADKKPSTKGKKQPTQKQQKLIKLISENLGNTGATKSMYQMMKEAGYSETTCRKQGGIMDSQTITDATNPVVQAMEAERDAAIERLKKVRSKAKYRDLIDGVDKLTKNIQLLSGKETERLSHTINDMNDDELAKLANLTRRS